MATNALTGDYEAVVQIAASQINALLGTLHQNGANSDAQLQFPHSGRIVVGRPPRRPPVEEFGEWLIEVLGARAPGTRAGVRDDLIDAAPPGAAVLLNEAFGDLDELVIAPPVGDVIRGSADAQISTVTISVTPGSTSELSIHAQIRAEYHPAPDTGNLPAPIHGEVVAAFQVLPEQAPSGRRLRISPSADDAKIQFYAAPGTLSIPEASSLATHIRQVLRQEFRVPPVDLPPDFPFAEFKGLATGGSQAIAVGLQLSGAQTPVGGLSAVNQSLTGSSGFAFAVSRDFLIGVLDPALDPIRQFTTTVPVEPFSSYQVSVTNVSIQFNSGSFLLRIDARATHSTLPNISIAIRQRCTLVLFLDRLFIAAPDDELSVQASVAGISFPTGDLKNRVIAARNAALPKAQDDLNVRVAEARARIDDALHLFDPSAAVRLRSGHSEESGALASGAVAITPDGIIVRGDFQVSQRAAPIIDVRETPDEASFTALNTWIPSGRIDRLVWTWVSYTKGFNWGGVLRSEIIEHQFTLLKPAGITEQSQVCLRVEGQVVAPDGSLIPGAGGSTCVVPVLDPIINVPPWWDPVMLPLWRPDIAADDILRDAVHAHVSLQGDAIPRGARSHNTLVFFPEWEAASPLSTLGEALEPLYQRGMSLAVVVVVPAGAFNVRRREFDAKVGDASAALAASLHITEDDRDGWSKTFAPRARPAMFLINARRAFDWRYDGDIAAGQLRAALARRLHVAPPPRAVPLRLNVSPGDRMLDASFRDQRGEMMSLHRFRGPILLNFCQPWSAPCRAELRRLEAMRQEGTAAGSLIMAFDGGPEQTDLDGVRKELGLTFPLFPDPHQVVARTYGVRCWPTTVAVSPDGRLEHVQFGVAPPRHRASR